MRTFCFACLLLQKKSNLLPDVRRFFLFVASCSLSLFQACLKRLVKPLCISNNALDTKFHGGLEHSWHLFTQFVRTPSKRRHHRASTKLTFFGWEINVFLFVCLGLDALAYMQLSNLNNLAHTLLNLQKNWIPPVPKITASWLFTRTFKNVCTCGVKNRQLR